MHHNINKIGVLCYYTFPTGMAATTRIRAYCKGLTQQGVECEAIIFQPLIKEKQEPLRGEVDGIQYSYSHVRSERNGLFYKLLIDRPLSIIKAVRNVYISNKKKKFDVILVSFDSLPLLYFFVPILNLLGIDLIFIGDEYPPAIRCKGGLDISAREKFLYRLIFKLMRGRILINEKLKLFFDDRFGVAPTHILPTIVDTGRFVIPIESQDREPQLSYLGGMDLTNDNVDLIIKAFRLIADKYPHFCIKLYGTPSDSDKNKLTTLITSLHLQDRVSFMGKADYDKVPGILAHSYVLVTSQSRTKRAEGGVPTKLGEYIVSGTPCLVSDVSNISLYFRNEEHLFLVVPDDVEAYAKKLEQIIDNYPRALLIAKTGRNYIIHNFGCESLTKQLNAFLVNIKNRKMHDHCCQ